MTPYKTTVIEMSVCNENDNPVFGDSVTKIKLTDEGGGFFIILSQNNESNNEYELRFDIEELEVILDTAKKMIKNVNKEN